MTAAEEFDHGFLDVPLQKRYGRGGIDGAIDRYKAAEAREARRQRRALAQEREAARIAEADRPKFAASDLAKAVLIRDRFGWHRVIRVNVRSVTVKTGHSWDDRIPIDRVIEFRSA